MKGHKAGSVLLLLLVLLVVLVVLVGVGGDLDSSSFSPQQLRKLAHPVIEKEIYFIFIQMTLQTWRERDRVRKRGRESERERERQNILSVWDDSSQPIRPE